MQHKLPFRIFFVFAWIIFIFCLLYTPNFRRPETSSLNIFTWGGIFDPGIVKEFENESGIKVNINYYDSNEELLVKLKATNAEGCDLIIPSDYAVKILIEKELIDPLDKERLEFIDRLEPSLLGHDYDPDNTYALPIQWEIFGLSHDGSKTHHSWNHLFSKQNYRVAMTNDPIEAFNLASFYLHGKQGSLSDQQIQDTKALLKAQKSQVEAYANYRAGYLIATKNCPLAVTASSMHYRIAKEFPFVRFSIPKEGSFMSIENIAIPKSAQNQDAVYDFLNFVYREDIAREQTRILRTFPAVKGSVPDEDAELKKTHDEALKRFDELHFFRHLIPEQALREIWVSVKS